GRPRGRGRLPRFAQEPEPRTRCPPTALVTPAVSWNGTRWVPSECGKMVAPDLTRRPAVQRREPTMRVGFALGNIGPIGTAENLLKIAQRAEALAYDSLWTVERLLWPVAPQTPYVA